MSLHKFKSTYQDKANRGMENAWDPMKKRNLRVVSDSLKTVVGTTSHIFWNNRKGPQAIEG